MAQSEVQTNIRLPVDLKVWLQHQARAGRRSLTQEVVGRLEQTRKRDIRRRQVRAAQIDQPG